MFKFEFAFSFGFNKPIQTVLVLYVTCIYIVGSVLIVCLATFRVAVQTFDAIHEDIISEWKRFVDIKRYFSISIWMVIVAAILYFSNGILAIVSLRKGYVINTKDASGKRLEEATKSGNSKSFAIV